MAKKVTITFNGKQIEVEEGQMVLTAVEKLGYEIPHYCFHEALSVAGSCRLCAVEVGYPDKDGNIKMVPPLVMSCQTPVREGMAVLSETEKVRAHRKAVLELLLINHPLDCPVCDQAGECYLQDYSFRHGRSFSRFNSDYKFSPPKKQIGANILLYSSRCILCTRCVRFTREISGGAELAVFNRGYKNEIDVFPGKPLTDKLAGNVVDICPVGAQIDKQFLFKQRVWFLNSTESVCPRCSRGCNIFIHHNQGVIWRLKPRLNEQINGPWMCDDGRYGYKFLHADERLNACRMRRQGQQYDIDLDEALLQAEKLLAPCLQNDDTGKLAAILSPAATCEEQFLLARWARQAAEDAILTVGPVLSEKKDETFKGGFTISAEKLPNRRGAQKIADHFGKPAMTFKQLLKAIDKGDVEAVWFQGGYPWLDWCPPENLKTLRRVPVLIVQDVLSGTLAEQADLVLAGAAWSEKQGCFINDQDMCQNFNKAVDPPGEADDDACILWRLDGREETFDLAQVRREMSDVIKLPPVEDVNRNYQNSNSLNM